MMSSSKEIVKPERVVRGSEYKGIRIEKHEEVASGNLLNFMASYCVLIYGMAQKSSVAL